MALKAELEGEVAKIFRQAWEERDGQLVPSPEDLRLGNDAVKLDATVLYADMSDSTKLVDQYPPGFAAEIYKSYLTCAAEIMKSEGGIITAYDGDRIMGVFIGDAKNTTAARTALKINGAVINIINPALARQYPKATYKLKHVVGVDTSSLLAARIGVRNDNDLVWVGRAANYAAKLCAINEENSIFISGEVFDRLNESSKYQSMTGTPMWTEWVWYAMDNMRIYNSKWTWKV